MRSDDLELRMRQLEWFHDLRALPGAWPIIRVDGRGFSKLTESRFEKPFDSKFHAAMKAAAEALLVGLQGIYAYTESDEISVLLPKDADLFDREVEKLVSVSAGIASSIFTKEVDEPAHFDSRLWLGPSTENVVEYFRWRQADATRCCLNGWCYWTLRKEGTPAGAATQLLHGKTTSELNEILFQRGVNFNDLPLWQRRGTGFCWEHFQKEGFNPVEGTVVLADRRRIRIDESLPKGEDYDRFLMELISKSKSPRRGCT